MLQVVDVGGEEVVAMRGMGTECACVGNAPDLVEIGLEQVVGAVLDPLGGAGVGGAAAGWVVLEAAVLGRVVRGRDDDAVGERLNAVLVVREDGMRECGRGGVTESGVDERGDAVGGEHLERGGKGRVRERVGILR